MDPIELGAIIHGTLRTEDLLPAFLHALESLEGKYPPTAVDLRPVREVADMHRRDIDTYSDDPEILSEIVEEIYYSINTYLPEGIYFGALDGDGAAFGFWKEEEGHPTA